LTASIRVVTPILRVAEPQHIRTNWPVVIPLARPFSISATVRVPSLQKFFHQGVVCLRSVFLETFPVFFNRILHVFGDRTFLVLAALISGEYEGLFIYEVHHSGELIFCANRELNRHTAGVKGGGNAV